MSHNEVILLRDRSLRMLSSAGGSLAKGDYDIAAFMAEQSVQLYVKSMLFEFAGEVPRIHVLRQLLNSLKAVVDRPAQVDQFVTKNRSLLIRLEDTYINSRYVPREYEKEEAKELVDFAQEAIEFAKHLKGKT
nr:HEPN domain-containing protein [Candidatus Njordarchaeota archaeon]